MADISYTRSFNHSDWIDNKDVVQAGGDNGFNQKFHGLEAELDKIGTVFAQTNTAISNLQRINFLKAPPAVTLAANTASTEFPIESYDRSALPASVEKIYFPIVLPSSGANRIFHTILYRLGAGNTMNVSIQFFNADTAAQAQFAFRILILATQSS